MTRAKDISKILTAPVFSGLTYPTSDGSANQFMKTDGSGTLSFATVDLTALSASNLTSGTIPDARFPATLPAISGANLTNLDATDLTGTIASARVSGAYTGITSVGTLTSFRSTGIDDNADAVAITIDSSERVGIGTSSPSDNLHLAETGATSSFIRFSNSNVSNGWSLGAQSSGRFQLTQNGVADRIIVDSSGNVGIGTTDFATQNGNVSTILKVGGTNNTIIAGEQTASNRNFILEARYNGRSGGDRYAQIGFGDDGSNNGNINFWTAPSGSGVSERMRILSGGEVAIGGTGYSGQPFSVQTSTSNLGYMQSTGTTRAVMNFVDANSTNNIGFGAIANSHVFMKDAQEHMRLDDTGLGIGISSQGSKLHAHDPASGGTANAVVAQFTQASNSSSAGSRGLKSTIRLGGQAKYIGLNSHHNQYQDALTDFSVSTDGGSGQVERVRIDSSGNVGIGETNPSQYYSGANQLVVRDGTANAGITIRTGSSGAGMLAFADGATTAAQQYAGYVQYNQDGAGGYMTLGTENVERIRIGNSNNQIKYNGVYVYYFLGSVRNDTAAYIDVSGIQSAGVSLVTAQYTHHNINNYGAVRVASVASYSGSLVHALDIQNVSSSAGGSWSISMPSSGVLRVTKTAGTYAGSGFYWVKVETYYG